MVFQSPPTLNFKTMVYNPNSRQRIRVSFFLKGGKTILWNKKTERRREAIEENLMLDGYMLSKCGKFNHVKQMPSQTFEAVEQQFKGFDKTAGSLKAFAASEGKGNPNLAVNPAKLSPSTLSTQFLTLTCQLGNLDSAQPNGCFILKTK